jgi:hypothetical protein
MGKEQDGQDRQDEVEMQDADVNREKEGARRTTQMSQILG